PSSIRSTAETRRSTPRPYSRRLRFRRWNASRPGTTSTRSSGPRRRTSPTSSARASASSSRACPRTTTSAATLRSGSSSSTAWVTRRRRRRRAAASRAAGPAGPRSRARPRPTARSRLGAPGERPRHGRLARDGARRVAIGYLRNDAAAEATAEELRETGAEVTLVRGNVGSERVLDEVRALGALDVLVHNAATGVVRRALETEDRHWDWTLNANARALLALARVAAPRMAAGSSIVAISSLGAQRVLENYALIGTSKAALEALVRYLAVELAPAVRVNAVSAGVVETRALEHFPN